jgi:hypothetical protein
VYNVHTVKKRRGYASKMVAHNGFIIQHAHSADGYTLQQHVQNVERRRYMVASIPSESVLVLNQESGGRPQQRAFILFPHMHAPLAAGSRQSPTLDQIQFMSIFLL